MHQPLWFESFYMMMVLTSTHFRRLRGSTCSSVPRSATGQQYQTDSFQSRWLQSSITARHLSVGQTWPMTLPVEWAKVKAPQRALEKLLRSYGNDPSLLLDCCRQVRRYLILDFCGDSDITVTTVPGLQLPCLFQPPSSCSACTSTSVTTNARHGNTVALIIQQP